MVVNPTVGAATVAALASIVQALILLRHDKRAERNAEHFDSRLNSRRNVYVIVREGDEETLIITPEDRRSMERLGDDE